MRKPSINIYLTVLAMYDNGVLIFSMLMLNIPAITDFQQQQMTNSDHQFNTLLSSFSPNFTEFILDPNSSTHKGILLDNSPIKEPLSPLVSTRPFRHTNHLNHLLNNSLNIFSTFCLSSNQTENEDKRINLTQFNSIYCSLLFQMSDYLTDEISTNLILRPNVECELLLNETISILNRFHSSKLVPDDFVMQKYSQLLHSAQLFQWNEGELDEQFCQFDCPVIDHPFSPLIYYVKIVYPLALIAQTGSIWTTCLITIERYIAVCHPLMTITLSTRTRAIWALSILSIMAFLFNLPRFAEVDTTCHQVRATDFRRNKIYYQVYYIFLNLSFNYILPLSLLSALNIKIYATVRQATSNRNELTRARQSELRLASMLVAIVAIFIACNAPAFVINCLELYFEVGTPVLELMIILSNVLVCFNSSINFVIYCIFGRKFRGEFIRLLRLTCRLTATDSSLGQRSIIYNGGIRGVPLEPFEWNAAITPQRDLHSLFQTTSQSSQTFQLISTSQKNDHIRYKIRAKSNDNSISEVNLDTGIRMEIINMDNHCCDINNNSRTAENVNTTIDNDININGSNSIMQRVDE